MERRMTSENAAPRRGHGRAIIGGVFVTVAVLLASCSAKTPVEQTTGTPSTKGTAPGAVSTGAALGTPQATPIVAIPEQEGVQHLKFAYGPIKIAPGQNNITISDLQVPKPDVDGFIVAIKPDLIRQDGSVPRVDVVHLHHGVWVNLGHGSDSAGSSALPADGPAKDPAEGKRGRRGGFGKTELFFASGEEKTQVVLPAGYGYSYNKNDNWVINYMLHNLLSTPDEVSIVYNMDFIPAASPGAKLIKPARPIWNDVEAGHVYPVFDALKKDGKNGLYTFPDDANNPYDGGRPLNTWTVDRDSVLLGTAGHLHPGGLYTDMYLTREGASATPGSAAAASVKGNKAHIFRSDAVYYEPAGAVSWDVSMTATPLDWFVSAKKGDVVSITATYDTSKASWYESMGIMVLWATDAANAPTQNDPFVTKADGPGLLTHGHLPENDNHGGGPNDGKFVDMTKLPSGPNTDTVTVADFAYAPGDMSGIFTDVPTVKPGQPLRFVNTDAPIGVGIWHTITACKAPCDKSTGVAYPLADADIEFDSGELGLTGGGFIAGQAPTAGRVDWTIPTDLSSGTYTYFCRIHPSMRGAFRVTEDSASSGGANTGTSLKAG